MVYILRQATYTGLWFYTSKTNSYCLKSACWQPKVVASVCVFGSMFALQSNIYRHNVFCRYDTFSDIKAQKRWELYSLLVTILYIRHDFRIFTSFSCYEIKLVPNTTGEIVAARSSLVPRPPPIISCSMNNQRTTSPYKTGLDVMQSHPLCRTHFGQYQVSSAALG